MKTLILNIPSYRISWIALGVFACALSLLYIVQINALVELTYRTAEFEASVKGLAKETAVLEMRAGETFSVSQLERMAQSLRFERVQSMSYIKIGGTPVAQNTR